MGGVDIAEGSNYKPVFDVSVNMPYIDFRGRTLDYLPEIGTAEFKNMPNLKIIVDENKYEDWMNSYGGYNWGPQICIDENGTKPVVAQPINRNDYLTITALEDNVSIGFTPAYTSSLQYNLTGKDNGWMDFPTDGIILGSTGDQISFKGEFPSGSKIGQFDLPNKCDLSGQLDCALVKNASKYIYEETASYTFSDIFKDCEGIINAKDLSTGDLARSRRMRNYLYQNTFSGCSNLLSAPELELGTIEHGCFFGLFNGCTNLNKIVLEATYSYINGQQYVVSVNENTLPDLSSKDEPGYLYVNNDYLNEYQHSEGKVNILNYAQSHNWVPLSNYCLSSTGAIRYWNKDNIGDKVTLKIPGSARHYIGGTMGTGFDYNLVIEYDPNAPYTPYICNIFTAHKDDDYEGDYDWELVGRNVIIGSSMTMRDVLDHEGIYHDNARQYIQVIIMGTITDEEI